MQRYLQKFAVKNFLEVRLGPFSTTVKRHNLLQANHHSTGQSEATPWVTEYNGYPSPCKGKSVLPPDFLSYCLPDVASIYVTLLPIQGVLEPKVPVHVSTQFGTANWTPYSEIKTVCKTPMPIKLCVGPSETSGVVMIV